MCEGTTALRNEVKPPTHKSISAAALEEITDREKSCVLLHPVYLWAREEGPNPVSGYDTSFGFPETLSSPAWPQSWAGAQPTPDLEDGNMVVEVILGQQGDLWPVPERLLWVADFKVPAVKLEQSEHFYLDFKGIPKDKHVNLF